MKNFIKNNKLVITYLSLLVFAVSMLSFIEVVKKEEIVFNNKLVKETDNGYDVILENTTISLTKDEFNDLYLYKGDRYLITYKYNRFFKDKKEIVKTKYIYR